MNRKVNISHAQYLEYRHAIYVYHPPNILFCPRTSGNSIPIPYPESHIIPLHVRILTTRGNWIPDKSAVVVLSISRFTNPGSVNLYTCVIHLVEGGMDGLVWEKEGLDYAYRESWEVGCEWYVQWSTFRSGGLDGRSRGGCYSLLILGAVSAKSFSESYRGGKELEILYSH